MSAKERTELEALTTWLTTFPSIGQILAQKKGRADVLTDYDFSSAIMEVALELCCQQDNSDGGESTMGHSGDVWDSVLNLTQQAARSNHSNNNNNNASHRNERRSLDPPVQDTPHKWNRHVHHAALANLLDGAVGHRDLQLRKEYIERIMGLTAETQRSLMSLIEQRRRQKKAATSASAVKTPSKRSSRTIGTPSSTVRSTSNNIQETKSSVIFSSSSNKGHRKPDTTDNRNLATATMSSPSPPYRKKPQTEPRASPAPSSSTHSRRASPGERMVLSPFSPYADSIAQSNLGPAVSAIQKESPILTRKPQNLFLSTPTDTNNTSGFSDSSGQPQKPSKSPRRSFDQAFGSDAPFSPARPNPNRSTEKSFFSPGLGDTAEVEKQFQSLKDINEDLVQQLAKKEAKEEELSQQLEQSAAHFRNEMMKMEAQARRREEDTTAHYQNQLSSLKQELSKLQQQYMEASRAQAELLGVRDEMELMMHTKNQLAEAQERLQTYREKVQQLNDVREALKREEEAHSKSVEECLRLETELKAAQPLRRQLEEYKTRAVEAEVRLTESQDELKKVKEQRWTSEDAGGDLERTLQSQQEEIMELRMRLKQETSSGQDGGQSSGVGDGLSELNPELKEEVFRLRNENTQLRAFAAKREDDAVSKLEQNLEDASRLGERYKMQYLSTRDQLEQTQRNLQASRDREGKLRTDVSEAMDKIKLAQAMVEDVSQQLYHCHEELKETRNHESELESELATWVDQAKELQDKSNALSAELRTRTNDLEVSKNRETKLEQQLTQWREQFDQSQASLNEMTELCRSIEATLEETKGREVALRKQVELWKSTSNGLEVQLQSLTHDLEACQVQLEESRAKEQHLKEQVGQATEFLREANTKCEELMGHLTETRNQLTTTKTELSQSQERVVSLQQDLDDMSARAEDAETISKQRMELVQNTRDRLTTALQEIDDLKQVEARLSTQVEEWTQQAQTAQVRSEELQSTLAGLIHRLDETTTAKERQEQELAAQSGQIQSLSQELQESKAKIEASDAFTERLQEELMELRQVLNSTQHDLQRSLSNETTMGEAVTHAEHMIFALEESIEREVEARRDVEDQLEDTLTQLEDLKAEFEATQARFNTELAAFMEQSNKFKQDLLNSQETLNETQGSLGAAQHREKMLKLEITKLQDQAADLQRELESAQQAAERASTEGAQSLEATCEILNAKAQREIDEIQTNMNRLLEDERRAKRQSDESYQRQQIEAKKAFEQQLAELKSTAKETLDESNKKHNSRVEQLRNDYEAQMVLVKRSAQEEQEKIVAKGKGMLKDVKAKSQQELEALRHELAELQNRFEAEQQEKERIIVQAKTKVATYKKKLEFASSRINSLTTDTDDLESQVRNLEREKFKLTEENELYRRQLGGRGGADSKLQGQLDLLQKEFKSAMEEARELRRKLKEKDDAAARGGFGSLDTIDENFDPSYSRDAVNQSTLGQLRSEYEETIEALNDEKRELVMKNSAAATDVQKAEKRAWESEQENADLKQKITSLQLQIERLEQLLAHADEGPPPPPPGIPPSKSSMSKSSRGSRRSGRSVKTEQTEPTEVPTMEEDETMTTTEINHGFTDVSSITPSKSGELSGSTIDSPPTVQTNSLCQAVYEATKQPSGNVLGSSRFASNNVPSIVGGSEMSPRKQHDSQDIAKAQKALPSFVELHGATIDKDAPPECKQC